MTEEIRCQKCGTQTRSTAKYCRKCGCEFRTNKTNSVKTTSVTRPTKCSYHPDRAAAATCINCGCDICASCRTEVYKKSYCPTCLNKLRHEKQLPERLNKPITEKDGNESSEVIAATQNIPDVNSDSNVKRSAERYVSDNKQKSVIYHNEIATPSKASFQMYIAQNLAQQLSFTKNSGEINSGVCDWRSFTTILEAGFNLGCSFSLTNGTAAQTILEETANVSATGKSWEIACSRIIQDLEQKEKMISEFFRSQKKARPLQTSPSDQEILNSTVMSYEFLFPEMRTEEYHSEAIASRDGCIAAISKEVLLGLIFGIKFPESALLTVKGWIYKKKTWGLTAGGEFSSVKDVFKAMETSYYSWSNKK